MYFDWKSINDLERGFSTFISQRIKSHKQYTEIVKVYLRNQVLSKVKFEEYEEIFNTERIREFQMYRKSQVVRYALGQFLEYIKEEGKIEKRFLLDYPDIPRPEPKKNKFLTTDDIKNLFSAKIYYKDEEKYIAPLVYSLAFFCGYEQRHLAALKMNDVIVEDRLISNVRRNGTNSHLLEWIQLNDVTISYLTNYLEYRKSLDTESDHLLLFENEPLNNNSLNKIFWILQRKDNKGRFDCEAISAQLLIKSGIFYHLISSNGSSLSQILFVQDWNEHIADARQEYLQNYAGLSDINSTQMIMSLDDILHGFTEAQNNLNYIESLDSETENFGANSYSEENDISMEDILEYDQNLKSDQKETKVSIQRLVRNSRIAHELKELYSHKCQLCGFRLRSSNGGYSSEAHHIQPYNRIHRGDDTIRNLLILCPNCHTQFDDLYFAINPITLKVHSLFEDDDYNESELSFIEGHVLEEKYLRYTWKLFIQKKNTVQMETV